MCLRNIMISKNINCVKLKKHLKLLLLLSTAFWVKGRKLVYHQQHGSDKCIIKYLAKTITLNIVKRNSYYLTQVEPKVGHMAEKLKVWTFSLTLLVQLSL